MTAAFRQRASLAQTVWRLLFAGLLTVGSRGLCPAQAADAADWQSLFNGKDLTGWVVKCKPADQAIEWWRVEEGVLVANSLTNANHDYVWLMTEKEYGDFVLRLQFRAFTNSPGNSGVQIRSRYDDEAFWLDGPQIDINPPAPWRTGMMWDETRGNQRWIYPNLPKGQWVKEAMAKPGMKFYFSHQEPGWNTLEITAKGNTIQAIMNGVLITDFDGAGILDDEIHRQRNVGLRGHICLQIHIGDKLLIHFKDIAIREL